MAWVLLFLVFFIIEDDGPVDVRRVLACLCFLAIVHLFNLTGT